MNAQRPSATWRERLASPLTWHLAVFAVLLIVAVALAIRLGLDWTAMNSRSNQIFAGKQVELKALQLETAPLRGIDQRVEDTREQMVKFEQKRIPPNYSSIDARVGELQVASGVHLSRVQYTQGKPGTGLTEISLDAGISGDYPSIMRFVNSLERDATFFVIRAMSFTGQRGGLVNLRIQLSTWLRPADAAASGLPSTPAVNDEPADTSTPGQEGE